MSGCTIGNVCTSCRCSGSVPDTVFPQQVSTIEACAGVAKYRGMSYFAFNSENKCRVPVVDEIDQCVTNYRSAGNAWSIYSLDCRNTLFSSYIVIISLVLFIHTLFTDPSKFIALLELTCPARKYTHCMTKVKS